MNKAFEVAVILTAVDKMSRVVKQATDKSISSLSAFGAAGMKAGQRSMDFGRQAVVTGALMAAPLVAATHEAIKFEDKMADVSKVLNLANGSRELQGISSQVKDTALYLGVAAEDAAGMYANLAQGGVAQQNLSEVAKIAGEIGVAFDLTSEQAGESFIKMQNAMGTTIAETKRVSDAINFLSDSTASKASEILTFMASGGSGVSRTLGIAGQDMAAFGASMISVGISANEAATTMERFQKGLLNPSLEANRTYKRAGQGLAGVMAVLKEGQSRKDPFSYFRQFGEYGTKIMLLAQTMNGENGLVKALNSVAVSANYADSVTKEFSNRQNTTAGRMAKLKTEVQILAVEVGTVLIPALNDLIKQIRPVIENVMSWVRRNPELTATISKAALAMAGLTVGVGVLSWLMGGALKIFSGSIQVISLFSSTTRAATLAQWGFNAAALANPYVYVALAIAMVIAQIVIAYVWFDEITTKIRELWEQSGILGKTLMVLFGIVMIGPLILFALVGAIRWLINHWEELEQSVSDAVSKIATKVSSIYTAVLLIFLRITHYMVSLPSIFYKAGINIVQSIIDGITSRAGALFSKMYGVAQLVRDLFPFSPAKRGPLRDIHRIKLIETIAGAVKPQPLLNAVTSVASQVRAMVPRATGLTDAIASNSFFGGGGSGSGGSPITVNFSPVITVTGGGDNSTPEGFIEMFKRYEPQLLRLLEDAIRKRNRTGY